MPKKPLDPLHRSALPGVGREPLRPSTHGQTVSVTLPAAMVPALSALKEGLLARDAGEKLVLDERKLDRLVKLLVTDRELKADEVEDAVREAAKALQIEVESDPRFFGI